MERGGRKSSDGLKKRAPRTGQDALLFPPALKKEGGGTTIGAYKKFIFLRLNKSHLITADLYMRSKSISKEQAGIRDYTKDVSTRYYFGTSLAESL